MKVGRGSGGKGSGQEKGVKVGLGSDMKNKRGYKGVVLGVV